MLIAIIYTLYHLDIRLGFCYSGIHVWPITWFVVPGYCSNKVRTHHWHNFAILFTYSSSSNYCTIMEVKALYYRFSTPCPPYVLTGFFLGQNMHTSESSDVEDVVQYVIVVKTRWHGANLFQPIKGFHFLRLYPIKWAICENRSL